MGSGKTTVGRLLAERIGYDFVDSDDEVVARAGLSVADVFRVHGEALFRELEQDAVRHLLQADRRVIATGGGAFARPSCAEDLLARSFTIHLSCDFTEAIRRAAREGGRPLVDQGETEAAALYAARKDKYARAHATVDTTSLSPEEAVAGVLRLLSAP